MEKEFKKCMNCGQENLVSAQYCNNCGSLLEENQDNVEEIQKEQYPCPTCCEMIDSDTEICPYCDEPTHFHVPSNDTLLTMPVKEELKKGTSIWKKIIIGILCVFGGLFIIGLLLPDEDDGHINNALEVEGFVDDLKEESIGNSGIEFNTIEGEQATDDGVICKYSVEYITQGNEEIVNAVNGYICNILGCSGMVDVELALKLRSNVISKILEEENPIYQAEDDISVRISMPNDYFVTVESFGQLDTGSGTSGGLWGYTDAATFDIGTGNLLSMEDLFPFEKIEDVSFLIEMDINNQDLPCGIDRFELPEQPPILTRNGITFNYKQYEIACGAAGPITCTLSYEEVAPYLKKNILDRLR